MKIRGGSSSPTHDSVFATYQGHFGAPFLMPARMGMFGTWVKMFGTFLICRITTGWGDCWFGTVSGTNCIDRTRQSNTRRPLNLDGWLLVEIKTEPNWKRICIAVPIILPEVGLGWSAPNFAYICLVTHSTNLRCPLMVDSSFSRVSTQKRCG